MPIDLSASDFSAKIAEPGVVVLDVRTAEEFSGPHIMGAINIDFDSDTFHEVMTTLDRSQTYALYCRSGRRSALAAELMHQLNFESLVNLTGGIIDWMEADLPVVRS